MQIFAPFCVRQLEQYQKQEKRLFLTYFKLLYFLDKFNFLFRRNIRTTDLVIWAQSAKNIQVKLSQDFVVHIVQIPSYMSMELNDGQQGNYLQMTKLRLHVITSFQKPHLQQFVLIFFKVVHLSLRSFLFSVIYIFFLCFEWLFSYFCSIWWQFLLFEF